MHAFLHSLYEFELLTETELHLRFWDWTPRTEYGDLMRFSRN